MKFDKTSFWIRLYDIPPFFMTINTANSVGALFGEVIEVDDREIIMGGRFIMVRVIMDITKPLRRGP